VISEKAAQINSIDLDLTWIRLESRSTVKSSQVSYTDMQSSQVSSHSMWSHYPLDYWCDSFYLMSITKLMKAKTKLTMIIEIHMNVERSTLLLLWWWYNHYTLSCYNTVVYGWRFYFASIGKQARAGTANSSGAPQFTTGFQCGSIFSFLYSVLWTIVCIIVQSSNYGFWC
jgi:hypothetical protein